MKINLFKSPNFKSIEIKKDISPKGGCSKGKVYYEINIDYRDNLNELYFIDEIDEKSRRSKRIVITGAESDVKEILNKPVWLDIFKYKSTFNDELEKDILKPLLDILSDKKELKLSFRFPQEQSRLQKLFALKPEDIFSNEEKSSVVKAIEKKISKMNSEKSQNFSIPIFTENNDIRDMRVNLNYLSINLDVEA